MTSIYRPTPPGAKKDDQQWLLKGPWGERRVPPMSTREFHGFLYEELVASGILPADRRGPSNSDHSHVVFALYGCKWTGEKWVKDPVPMSGG